MCENKSSLMSRRTFIKIATTGSLVVFASPSIGSGVQSLLRQDKQETVPSINNDDIYNIIRGVVLTGLGAIPYAGTLVSIVVDTFWPSAGPSAWDQVKAQVNRMVDDKISEQEYQLVSEFLTGLGNNLKSYLAARQEASALEVARIFSACHQIFINEAAQFQTSGRERLLLPLFVHFATLHLAMLRDAILNRASLGWSDKEIAMYTKIATSAIRDYKQYVSKVYSAIQADADSRAEAAASSDWSGTEKFRISNECRRNYQLSVLDFSELFDYFDPVKYPNKVDVEIRRVIYSDPVGSTYENQLNTDPPPCQIEMNVSSRSAKMAPPLGFDIYSGGKWYGPGYTGGVVGYVSHYESGQGPNGTTIDDHRRLNHQDDPMFKIDCTTEKGPVCRVLVPRQDAVFSIQFFYKNGSSSPMAGGCLNNYPPNLEIAYDHHILVDIAYQWYSRHTGCLGCIVLGFQLENMGKNPDPLFSVRQRYIYSLWEPKLPDLADFVRMQTGVYQQLNEERLLEDVQSQLASWSNARRAFWENCRNALSKTTQ